MERVLVFLIIGGTISLSMFFAYLSSKAKAAAEAAKGAGEGDAPGRQEFEVLQDQVAELAERLDFTERLLAQQREAPRLNQAKE